jgi:peptidase E
MANTTPTKTPWKSTNFWTGIATVLAAGFAYFGISADAAAAVDLADTTTRAVEAIESKNWALLFGVGINVVNIVTHLWKTYFSG